MVEQHDFDGVLLIKPPVFEDDRGHFMVAYNKKAFNESTNIEIDFIQDNESKSSYGTLRGLHFQTPPFAQSKLVRVSKGEVLDVIVDLRSDSKTFGQSASFILNDENKYQLFIPKGFAHGFLVLSTYAIFSYKVDALYAPDHDSGILWNDRAINIDWQIDIETILLSEKDNNLMSFESYKANPYF
ncbi:MAG: dTDP-4-dehydrorhamnose 3,5-epimerase [Bacteroidia bacterium]|nr:dTDP-4-dehydrorhamnose 3,5-epimerase [Bacteroidia bacterium]